MTAVEHNERKTCHCFMSVRHQDRRTYLVWQRLPGRATAASMSRQSGIPSPRAASPRECRSATQANSPSAPLGPKRADARLWTSAFQAATRVQWSTTSCQGQDVKASRPMKHAIRVGQEVLNGTVNVSPKFNLSQVTTRQTVLVCRHCE